MPEITPVAPAVPAAPAPVAGVAPAGPTPNDTTASAFVGQLTAALKSLAAAVGGKPATLAQATADATTPPAAADDESAPPAAADTDTPSDDVVELLASLGLVAPPTPQPIPVEAATAAAAKGVPAQLSSLQAPTPEQAAPTKPAETVTPPTTEPAKHETAPSAAPQEPPAASAQAPVVEAPRHADAPVPQVPTGVVPPTVQAQVQNGASGGSFDQSEDHTQHHTASKAESVADVTAQAPTLASDTVAAAAVAPATAPPPPPASAHATNVAQQIAQQVDLYRLPGNKGVRIQLHPDDLGGVQVTLRYAAGGNLELHINVEHAATGNLVQEGLSQLRDALATQGFQADRLVMSVSSPAGAGQAQMDFNANSGNGGYRSDAGLAGFTQDGQSGQQRDGGSGADDWRGGRRWNLSADSISSSDDASRAANTYAAASRIDYRV